MRHKETRRKETRHKETRYKDENFCGKLPQSGAIFMSNIETNRECLDRKLFGLPYNMSDFVLSVKKGMLLFLYEFENRLLYGVFRATCDGEINIQPGAFRKKFPAQVRFTTVWDCSPLAEHEFRDAIKDNYYSMKKFNFGLNQDQVDNLMTFFYSKKISKNPERNAWGRGDKPAEGHARFGGDLGRTIVDRLRVMSQEDDDIHSNDVKIVEVDKVSCGSRERFKKNHLLEDDDFGDSGSRKKLPGNHLDHSLVGLKREADVGSHYMVNENKGHEFNNNHKEFRGLIDEGNFSMMEKTKVKNDTEDDYIPLYTPEIDAKFLMDSEDKDIMDYNRLRDEYNVRNDFRQSLSGNYLGRSCDIGSRRITDEYFPGNDALETELRTLNEQSLGKSFVDVSSPHLNQDTFWTARDPTIPYIPLNPSYLTSVPSFIPLECRPIYPQTDEITPSFHSHNEDSIQYSEENLVSKTSSREGSLNPILPKFTSLGSKKAGADENYTEGHKSHAFGSGITPFAAYKDSYHEEPTSKYVKKVSEPTYALKRPSSDADQCVHKEDSYNDTISHQTCENKRVSVFARLNSNSKHEKEPETVKEHVLNASVDDVMKMLEKVASNPTNEAVKVKSVNKLDDDDITPACEIVHKVPDSVMDLDADLAAESIEDKLVVKETRVVDFKRRKKTNKNNTELGGATSDSSCKRRKLVRPAFVKKESTGAGVSATKNTDMPCEITPSKDESCPTKVVVESKEQAGGKESTGGKESSGRKLVRPAFVKKDSTGAGVSATKNTDMPCEITPSKDESCPMKVVVESKEQVGGIESTGDGISATKHTDMLCEITSFKDESCSTEVLVESKEQAGEKESTCDGISATKNMNMLCEITPSQDESCPTNVVVESKEQVAENESTGDGISAIKDTNMLCEVAPFRDESFSTKVVVETKEQVDDKESTGDGISATKNTNMLCEITPFKDESCSMEIVVESQEQVGGKESTGDGISATKNTNMLCEITPFKDESCSMEAGVESKEQADDKESTSDGTSVTKNSNMLCEITPFKDESCPTKVVVESKEQEGEKEMLFKNESCSTEVLVESKEQAGEKESTGDGISATKNTNKLCEITPFKDESCTMEVVVESKEQAGKKDSTGDGISATKNTNMLCEIAPFKDESCPMKVVVESKEQVGEKESTGDGISSTIDSKMLCEVTPSKDESCSMEVVVESKEHAGEKDSTGDGISATKNTNMLYEITPSKDESCPMKVLVESKEQVGEKESTGDGISSTIDSKMLREVTPFKDESCSMEVVVESKEHAGEKDSTGDGISATKNTNMLSEITPSKDESCPIKVLVESKEQVGEKESTGDGISATKDSKMLCEVTPSKDEGRPTKVVVESKEQVGEKESTGNCINATKDTDMLCEVTPFKDESCSTKVVFESKEQVDDKESTSDGINAAKSTVILCEITPFKGESFPTKVVKSKDQVNERESTGEGILSTKNKDMLCEVIPLKGESNSMKVMAETNEQVDEFIKSVDIMPPYEKTVLPTFNENTLFKDDVTSAECQKNVDEGKECSTKARVERSEKNDGFIKLVQMSNECKISVREGEERSQFGDGNVENISCNDESSSAEVAVERSEKVDGSIKPVLTPGECHKNVGEGEKRSQIEDRNAATRLTSDVFVEVAQVSSKDDHKMCGWIFE